MERKSKYPIDKLFMNRWSPRAMSGEEINDEELMTLFEAARWAPSSYNNQPWRFVYSKKNTRHFEQMYDFLIEFNQKWCEKASALVVVISRKTFEKNDKPSKTHSYDTGAAWQNLALQGSLMGLVVHGMEGFDYSKAKKMCQIPENYEVEAMIAIGKKGDVSKLPQEIQEKEFPSDRKPIESIVMEGLFQEEEKSSKS
jgi:nitroreductase